MGKGYRQNRLGEEIRKLISEMLLRELKDPRLKERMISITAVSVTRNDSYATCYITVLDISGDDEQASRKKSEILEGFENAVAIGRASCRKRV